MNKDNDTSAELSHALKFLRYKAERVIERRTQPIPNKPTMSKEVAEELVRFLRATSWLKVKDDTNLGAVWQSDQITSQGFQLGTLNFRLLEALLDTHYPDWQTWDIVL